MATKLIDESKPFIPEIAAGEYWGRGLMLGQSPDGKSDVADECMKPLTPEIKDVVRWVNKTLDSDDLNAWRKK